MTDIRHLPRFHVQHERIRDQQKLARILLETGEAAPTQTAGSTAGGDARKLRGIPAIARGVAGAHPGTAPHSDEAIRRMDNAA